VELLGHPMKKSLGQMLRGLLRIGILEKRDRNHCMRSTLAMTLFWMSLGNVLGEYFTRQSFPHFLDVSVYQIAALVCVWVMADKD